MGLIFEENFRTSKITDTGLRVIANNQALLLQSHDARTSIPVYLNDQEVDDLIVLLTYYKTNKISQGFTWKEADE